MHIKFSREYNAEASLSSSGKQKTQQFVKWKTENAAIWQTEFSVLTRTEFSVLTSVKDFIDSRYVEMSITRNTMAWNGYSAYHR
jgi:hypothetical protein